MIADEIIAIGALIYFRSWEIGIIMAVLITFRRSTWLANEIARRLDLDSQIGMTAAIARVVLPAWESPDRIMSRSAGVGSEHDRAAVVAPVPGSLVSPGQTPDRDISRDGWIVKMAMARDEHGDYIFSANQIDKAIGAHRATTLDKIRTVRSTTPPAQYRQDDHTTAPADYPISKSA